MPISSIPANRSRVLWVDDEPQLLAGIADVLRRQFDVTTAEHPAAALDLLRKGEPFTVVVSDYSMPAMNGVEFLARARVTAPGAVRLLLTGHASLEAAMAAVNDGHVFRFLTKPCPPATLIRALEDAVEQARLITADRVLLEDKLESMSASLVRAERLASLGTMAGAVGHELNNILTVFAGTMEFVAEDAANGVAPSNEALQSLREVQEHLALHARNLLQMGKPPRSSDAAETTDLVEAMTSVLTMMRLGGLTKRVTIGVALPRGPVPVRVAKPELEQVLVNLIKNAVEAFAAPSREDPRIDLAVERRADGQALCTIADNAGGIPAAQVSHLFEPYYTTKPPDRGTGLGLFVVDRVLRSAGGTVTVDSTPGEGTTFTLTIPVAAPARPRLEALTAVVDF